MQTKSLRDQLLEKVKPEHQNNDQESLDWIGLNKPNFNVSNSKISEEIKRMAEIKPWDYFRDDFYSSKQTSGCIHGKNHAMRVAINILLLYFESRPKKEIAINDLIYSALFHDCSRINDSKDVGHGERSSGLLKSRAVAGEIEIKDLKSVLSSIYFHDLNYEMIEGNPNYTQSKTLCDLLKTADSLDRYRFPRNDWWIDDKCLKIIPSDTLKNFAFNLSINSEQEKLTNSDVNYNKVITKIS